MNSFFSDEELSQVGFQSVGSHVLISRKASFYSPEKITLGNHVRVDDFCILSGNITIGNYVHVAAFSALYGGDAGILIDDFANLSSRTTIYAVSDDYSGATMTNPMIPDDYKNLTHGQVHVHRHVIIGSSSVILPGVDIGEGCSIGSLSLIKNDLPDWVICAGIPARSLHPREKTLLQLEKEFLAKVSTK